MALSLEQLSHLYLHFIQVRPLPVSAIIINFFGGLPTLNETKYCPVPISAADRIGSSTKLLLCNSFTSKFFLLGASLCEIVCSLALSLCTSCFMRSLGLLGSPRVISGSSPSSGECLWISLNRTFPWGRGVFSEA